MHNAHNYEFTSMIFTLVMVIGLQVNHTIQLKLLMFNITTTKSKCFTVHMNKAAVYRNWNKTKLCFSFNLSKMFVCSGPKFEEEIRRSERRKWRFWASNEVEEPRSFLGLDPPLSASFRIFHFLPRVSSRARVTQHQSHQSAWVRSWNIVTV